MFMVIKVGETMDKNQYKELIGDYVNKISILEKRIKKLEKEK